MESLNENKQDKVDFKRDKSSEIKETYVELLNTSNNRKTHMIETYQNDLENSIVTDNVSKSNISEAMLWHIRLGHVSKKYLLALAKDSNKLMNFDKISKDMTIQECNVCLQANSVKFPFTKIRDRSTKPLQVIHGDTMGPISPVSHPGKFKFELVLIDDATRAALAFPMKNKTEVPEHIESLVRSLRNLIGADEKFCYLRCDRGTEFVSQATKEVLDKFGAELQLA